jgi:hypothetical protein
MCSGALQWGWMHRVRDTISRRRYIPLRHSGRGVLLGQWYGDTECRVAAPRCYCRAGYASDKCARPHPHWGESGVCAGPCSAVAGQSSRVLSIRCDGESYPGSPSGSPAHIIVCAAGYDPAKLCAACAPGFVRGDHDTCTACEIALHCNAHGTRAAVCTNPAAGIGAVGNACVCRTEAGFGGAECAICDAGAGWQAVEGVAPLACRKCGCVLGAQTGLCGTPDRCACAGRGLGARAKRCIAWVQWRLRERRKTTVVCIAPGYARRHHPARLRRAAACTACADGHIAVGTSRRPLWARGVWWAGRRTDTRDQGMYV